MRARYHHRWPAAAGGLVLVGLLLAAATAPTGVAGSRTAEFYVAVGGSASVGWQPTAARPGGERTDTGYANDLEHEERSRWSDLRLVRLGCPGASTLEVLDGGDHCHYRAGSQMLAAVAFLHRHPSTVLLTVDLGFNDMAKCMRHQLVDQSCVAQALATIRAQLPQILTSLHAAGSTSLQMIGVGHYDPYLADYLDGATGRAFAAQSLDVISELNQTLRSVYQSQGVPMADVASSFDMSGTEPTSLAGVGTVPRDVAQVCHLTWMCSPSPFGPNPHPNDGGYRLIGDAIGALVTDR